MNQSGLLVLVKSATEEDAQKTAAAIVRDQVKVMYGEEAAENVRVQYGGIC